MAMELRNALSVSLVHSLPATILFDYPTVETLVGYLAREVPALGLNRDAREETPEKKDERAKGISCLERLSDREAEALLVAELASLREDD